MNREKAQTGQETPNEHSMDEGAELLDAVLASTPAASERIDGIVVAQLVGHADGGEPVVDFAANPSPTPLPARSIAALGPELVGRDVAVMFEQGNARRPIIMGVMADVSAHRVTIDVPDERRQSDDELREEDDEQIVLTLDKRLVVRCGKASLILTPAGKIIVRGEYVLTRAKGVNRIQGGSVQIN
jgi:hypothetical protein